MQKRNGIAGAMPFLKHSMPSDSDRLTEKFFDFPVKRSFILQIQPHRPGGLGLPVLHRAHGSP